MSLMYLNREYKMKTLANGDAGLLDILKQFTSKELWSLEKNPDLLDKLREIAKLTEPEAWEILEKDYGLSLQNHCSVGVWVSTEEIEDNLPKDTYSSHCGWFLVPNSEEFLQWARNMLAKEIRINTQIRYLLHRKDHPGQNLGKYGMYL